MHAAFRQNRVWLSGVEISALASIGSTMWTHGVSQVTAVFLTCMTFLAQIGVIWFPHTVLGHHQENDQETAWLNMFRWSFVDGCKHLPWPQAY